MPTFPSIRQNLRLIEEGLWHTPAYRRSTVVQSTLKPTVDGLSETCNTLSDGCLKLFSGRNSGRRRRRGVAKTYIALAFGLSVLGCTQDSAVDYQMKPFIGQPIETYMMARARAPVAVQPLPNGGRLYIFERAGCGTSIRTDGEVIRTIATTCPAGLA
jgi:hypothetical protein